MIYNDIQLLSQEIAKQEGRLLALDVGTKRIGVAISDISRFISNPKLIINRKNNQEDFAKIKELLTENKVIALVLGLPINMDGSDNEMTNFVKKFAADLDKFLEDFKILFFDERLTTHSAKQIGVEPINKKKSSKRYFDDIAASLILQDVLDQI